MGIRVHMNWDADVLQARLITGKRQALRNAGNYILDESRKQVPLRTGALMRSGAVDASDEEVTVSYDTPYAVRWHEHDANFQRGRKKKYLEDVINDKGVHDNILRYLGEGYHF